MTHCFLSPDGPRFLHVKINRKKIGKKKKEKNKRRKKKKLFSPQNRQWVIYSCSHSHPPPRTGWDPGARQSYTNKPATGNYLANRCNFARCAGRAAEPPGLQGGRSPARTPRRGGRRRRAGARERRGCRRSLRRARGGGGARPFRAGGARPGRAERSSGAAALPAPGAAGSPRATALRRRRPRGSGRRGRPQSKCIPAGGSEGEHPEVTEQAPAGTRGEAGARISAYLCLGGEGGPGSVSPAGPAVRVSPPSAGLREIAAVLVPGPRRRRGSGRAGGGLGRERAAAGAAARRAGAAQSRGGFFSAQPAGRVFWV